MAPGPNRVPGRLVVPPSNGAPTNTTSYPSLSVSSVARGTPAKVMSGPYMARVISGSGMVSRLQQRLGGLMAAQLRRSGHHSSQPSRQPPVRLAQHLHHRRHEHEPDHGRV